MEAWIPLTIAAAAAQSLRFMAQKQLKAAALSTGGATLARFLYSAPLILGLLALYVAATGVDLPALSSRFWSFALTGGLAQILATMCVVAMFDHRNFAVGIAFKKTEVMLTALAGFAVLGDTVSAGGALAIGIGFLAVLLLSDPPQSGGAPLARIANRATALGLLSGVFFAISAVGYRGATLALGDADTGLRAAVTLAVVTAFQTLALGGWLILREPGQVSRVLRAWRGGLRVGVLSLIGSFCWFAAFSLQSAAYVFALGQIELIFSAAIALFVFGERITRREAAGMILLTLSIVTLVALR